MQTAALFDLDGVLIDTETQYSHFWQAIGAHDFPDRPDFAPSIKGRTLVQIFREFYPDNTTRQAEIQRELQAFERDMSFEFIPGASAFVASLREHHIPTAVVTSSAADKMESLYRKVPHFAERFDHVFKAEDFPRSKPAPDCYLMAARHFGLNAADCFVFEDSLNGLRAGRDSGATVIGLATTHSADLISPLCDAVIPDFSNFTVEQMLTLKSH